LPALKVKPPRVAECDQHLECRLNQIIRPNENQMNCIGDIITITINEELLGKSKLDRVKAADPLFLLGMDITTFNGYYGGIGNTQSYTPPKVDVWDEE